MSKLKTHFRNLILRQKTYTFCCISIISIPLIDIYWHSLNFEFILGAEIVLILSALFRHALSKIQGHNLKDKI